VDGDSARPTAPSGAAESAGLPFGVAACGIWGVAPVYWKELARLPPVQVLAHRILWSHATALLLLAATRGFGHAACAG